MSPLDAAKFFRAKADIYLDMIAIARDEGNKRRLHELFEESEARAELLERMLHSHPDFAFFRIACRKN